MKQPSPPAPSPPPAPARDPKRHAGPPPGFRIVETSSSRVERFDTENQEYLTWLLAPPGRDALNDWLKQHGRYEYELVRIASRLLPQGGTFVDVGASAGPWALQLAKARKDAQVEAFEPEWMLFHQLSGNIFLNNLQNVHAHRFALGSRQKTERLHLPDSGRRAEGSLIPGTGRAMQEVPVAALDDLLIHPSVMKINVNGYEHEVIEGGFATLAADHPILFFKSPDPMRRGDAARGPRTSLFAMLEIKLQYNVRQLDTQDGEHFIAYPPARYAEVEKAIADEKALK